MSTAESSDNLPAMLAAAEARAGLPKGIMAAVWQQETGGDPKYLKDPTTYHYPAGPDGRRVAAHSGAVSTAFGPFGIVESTAAKPGFGVAPMKDKSLGEQVRFAADYLAARTKSAGSLEAGLAGYGEGPKYASEVIKKLGKGAPEVVTPPVVMATAAPQTAAPLEVPPQMVTMANAAPVAAPAGGTPLYTNGPDAWQAFLSKMPKLAPPVQVADLDFLKPKSVNFSMPAKSIPLQRPNFAAFASWKGTA